MGHDPPRVSRSVAVAVVVAATLLLGVGSGVRMSVVYASRGRSIPWGDALFSGLLDWTLWACLLPGIVWLVRRFRIEVGRIVVGLVVHGLGGAAFALVHVALFAGASAAVREWRFGGGSFADELGSGLSMQLPAGLAVYWAIALAVHALDLVLRVRVEETRRARLEATQAEARLEALRARLRPHFLFNALNGVLALVRRDPERAERMLLRLSHLLRVGFRDDRSELVRLEEELELVGAYLDVQRERIGERLDVRVDVPAALLAERVPTLVLQPLVENAVEHGVAGRADAGVVEIRAVADDGRLRLEVLDDGRGPDGSTGAGTGLGLGATRERLRLLYHDGASLVVEARPGGGTRVAVELPRTTQSAPEAS